MEGKKVNWEKVGVYFAICTAFFALISYIMDAKERIAKLEVKVTYLEKQYEKER